MIVLLLLVFSCSAKWCFAGSRAPELFVSEWINGDPGMLIDMRGKVVVLDFFQMIEPECSEFSIPLIAKWERKYKGSKNIKFISIHTVYEEQGLQTPQALKAFVKKKGINHPVGIDMNGGGSFVPITMRKYRALGTPFIAVIDKKGSIRFRQLGVFETDTAEKIIDMLVNE